jgi:hypothetical protein
MFKKYYYTDLYRVVDGKLTLTGSRLMCVWFFGKHIYAYQRLGSADSKNKRTPENDFPKQHRFDYGQNHKGEF